MAKYFEVDFRKGSFQDTMGRTVAVTGSPEIKKGEKGLAVNCVAGSRFLTYNSQVVPNDAFTIVVWCKWNKDSGVVYAYNRIISNSLFFNVLINVDGTKRPYLMLNGSNARYFSYTIDNNWHCYIFTLPGSAQTDIINAQLYVDGVLITPSDTYSSEAQSSRVNASIVLYNSHCVNSNVMTSYLATYDHVFTEQERIKAQRDFESSYPMEDCKTPDYTALKPTDLSHSNGITAGYTFQSISGTIVDLSGNSKTGTLSGNPISTKEGMKFDGVDDKVTLGNLGNVKSVSFRIKPYSTTCKILEGAANDKLVHINAGTLTSADFATKYVDGVAGTTMAANVWNTVTLTSATDVALGACTLALNNATYGKFEIEDLRFYSTTLSLSQVQAYHNQFAERITLREDFSAEGADNVPKVPTGWSKSSGSFKVGEIITQDATLKHLDKGTKYIYCNTAGKIKIECTANLYDDCTADVVSNGSWNHVTGKLSDFIGYFRGSSLSNGSLKIGLEPREGFTNLVIRSGNDTKNITEANIFPWYGYELNEASSSPDVTRIASDMTLHASLPIQSLMKGCVLDDNGNVVYYLKSDDWSKKADGTASDLTGTDGQVMVEIPRFYHKIENPSAGIYRHKISLSPIVGFTEVPKFYVSPSQTQIQRSSLKLSSVRNMAADYRGGGNDASWDLLDKTLLGKPATVKSLTNFRTYARNRGSKWNVLPYRQVMLLYDLFIIEYATRNVQKAVNANLTAEGYKQGGLGVGVTELWDYQAYNGYHPIVPCGGSDSLGNGSGEVSYAVPGSGVSVKIPRFRGIENLFGHIWEWHDGASIYHQTAEQGGLHKFYTCDNPSNFADDTAVNYDYRADLPVSGWLKDVTHDAKGIMIPKAVGADSVTNYCDYYYTPADAGGYWVAVLRGGDAGGGNAGFVVLDTSFPASVAVAYIGARLCYLP